MTKVCHISNKACKQNDFNFNTRQNYINFTDRIKNSMNFILTGTLFVIEYIKRKNHGKKKKI